jgi:hypothetical protein
MEPVRDLADLSIRRGCGFAGLAVGTVMLAFSFDLVLSLRSGAALVALLCLALAAAAWWAPRRDMRQSELWILLSGTADDLLRRLPRARAQALLAGVLRERLLWHADRAGLVALLLWVLTGLLAAARTLSE